MNESDERAYATRMLRILDTGLGGLDRDVAQSLAAARRSALERLHASDAGRHPALAVVHDVRFGMAVATVLAVMAWTLVSWWPYQRPGVQEIGQIDIQLLTGELPPGAYIDEDFPAWRRLPGLCRS